MRRPGRLLAGLLLAWWAAAWAGDGTPVRLSTTVAPGERHMGIRLLGTVRIAGRPVGGHAPRGLSALAWDEDEQRLYAVSDLGALFHLRPRMLGERLVDVEVARGMPLRDGEGAPLGSGDNDAEGLALVDADNGVPGDTRLVVTFEIRPRVVVFDARGHQLARVPLPPPLDDPRRFNDVNSALEAVTVHPRWGLLTAPELPLRAGPGGLIPIVAEDGRRWGYRPSRARASALVAMEALPDGTLLTLERAYVSMLHPLIITLRHARLGASTGEVILEDVARLDSSRGWRVDNFEGLTRYRDQRFFMVSDDNLRAVQSTLLSLFRWPAVAAEPPESAPH